MYIQIQILANGHLYPTNLKRTTKPYASNIMPKIGHPMITKKNPKPKEIVPCINDEKYTVKQKACTPKKKHTGKGLSRMSNLKILTFHKELHG